MNARTALDAFTAVLQGAADRRAIWVPEQMAALNGVAMGAGGGAAGGAAGGEKSAFLATLKYYPEPAPV